MRVLLIRNDFTEIGFIRNILLNYFVVELQEDSEDALYQLAINSYDLAIYCCSTNLPKAEEFCTTLRNQSITTPIVVITHDRDLFFLSKILDSGADDYLLTPLTSYEFLSRIRAVIRRTTRQITRNTLQLGDLTLDIDNFTVRRGDLNIKLRRKEFHILEYLLRNRGQVLTRNMIFDHVWESDADVLTNAVDVHIKYLRDSIDRPFKKKLIKTVHGVGYMIDD